MYMPIYFLQTNKGWKWIKESINIILKINDNKMSNSEWWVERIYGLTGELYCVSKKFLPFLYRYSLNKIGQVPLDKLYLFFYRICIYKNYCYILQIWVNIFTLCWEIQLYTDNLTRYKSLITINIGIHLYQLLGSYYFLLKSL